MPDSSKNFAVDTTNAPVGADSVTRTEFIDILEHLNYVSGNIRSIDELSTAGMLSIDGTGTANVRTLQAGSGLSVSNATGGAGNPSYSIDAENAWNELHTTESNAVPLGKRVSIIGAAGSYALPTPTSGQVFCKVVINNSSGDVVLSGSALNDKDALGNTSSSLTIPPNNMAILYSDLAQKWYAQVSSRTLIQ